MTNNQDEIKVGNVGNESAVAAGRWAVVIKITTRWLPVVLILLFIIAALSYFLWRSTTEPLGIMDGEWNVAVAGFSNIGDETIKQSDIDLISSVFFNRLESELAALSNETDIIIKVWGPDNTGMIEGETADERAQYANNLAKEINADVIIYGSVLKTGETLQLRPEFYVSVDNFYEAEEMVGQHALGSSISIIGSGEDLPTQINLNRELSRRSQVLALLTRGLSLFSLNAYEDALTIFEDANHNDLWRSDKGRELVYLFIGNAAGKASLLEISEEAFLKAIEIEPEYSRAYAGLGSLRYAQSIENVSAEAFQPDLELLQEAVSLYYQAQDAQIQPLSAEIPTKVAFGLGKVYLTQWFLGEDTLNQASELFLSIIHDFEAEPNSRIQWFAAESYANLGLIDRQLGNLDEAIRYFEQALRISTSPNRNGLYWVTLADLYQSQGQSDQADEANQNAINGYLLAISLTSQEDKLAQYWTAIANRYEKLGQVPEAIAALEMALEYTPPDSEIYQLLLARIDILE